MNYRNLVFVLAGALVAIGCQGQQAADAPVDLEVREQRASYVVGLDMASNFRDQELPIQTEALLAGMRDGLEGDPRLEGEELMAAIGEFRAMVNEAMAANAGPEAEANLIAGREFCARNAERSEVTVTESGLQYEVIEQGDGLRPTASDTVVVHYRGTTIDGEVFDESYARGEPSTFGVGQVISGWTEGLQLMPVGSKYMFWIPAELAYGPNPRPGSVFGPNATLIFHVELLEILGD